MPGHSLFQIARDIHQCGLVTQAGGQLYADGQAVGAGGQRQRHRRLTGNIEHAKILKEVNIALQKFIARRPQ